MVGVVELLAGYPGPTDWYVGFLMVAPEARGAGLGASVFREAAGRVAQAGGRTLHLIVRDDNPRAIAFWERQGFTFVNCQVQDLGTKMNLRAQDGPAGLKALAGAIRAAVVLVGLLWSAPALAAPTALGFADARAGQSLDGAWHVIVDPYDNGLARLPEPAAAERLLPGRAAQRTSRTWSSTTSRARRRWRSRATGTRSGRSCSTTRGRSGTSGGSTRRRRPRAARAVPAVRRGGAAGDGLAQRAAARVRTKGASRRSPSR